MWQWEIKVMDRSRPHAHGISIKTRLLVPSDQKKAGNATRAVIF